MKQLKRFKLFIISLAIIGILLIINKNIGIAAIKATSNSFRQMILIIPPIFVLIGLLDVWVPREVMVKYLGKGSGVKGTVIALLLGSMTAGPLYGAFPVVAIFMKKGATLFNMIVLLGAWSTTKIPMLMYEFSALGVKFALTRLLLDIPGIIVLAFLVSKTITQKEEEKILENLSLME